MGINADYISDNCTTIHFVICLFLGRICCLPSIRLGPRATSYILLIRALLHRPRIPAATIPPTLLFNLRINPHLLSRYPRPPPPHYLTSHPTRPPRHFFRTVRSLKSAFHCYSFGFLDLSFELPTAFWHRWMDIVAWDTWADTRGT